jgi:hypothetical protein
MNIGQVYEDSLFMEEGTIDGIYFLKLADEFTFWPKGEGVISKAHLVSAKNNGAKQILINCLQSGNLFITPLEEALRGGTQDHAVFLRHNMKKAEDSDLHKQE